MTLSDRLKSIESYSSAREKIPSPLARIAERAEKCALAYSGGVDSAYLLHALIACGADVKAYFARTAFTPSFEVEDAKDFADAVGARLEIVDIDVLSDENIAVNSAFRCYHCKSKMLSVLIERAREDGRNVLFDGTNFSDDDASRPGARALSELGVRSPLREAEMTKDDVRRAAKEAGLTLWDKPSYSCLATRVKQGIHLDADTLSRVESAEKFLKEKGFSDFRVRVREDSVCVEIRRNDFHLLDIHRDAIALAAGRLFPRLEIGFAERI